MRRFLWLAATLAMCRLVCAEAETQGTTPKPKPTDYPVQARIGDLVIAAEYLLHTLPAGSQSFVVPNYLVIEIAAYPAASQPVEISGGLFTLRVNGKKEELHAQAPGMVAASLKYSDWEMPRGMEAGVGPVILGRRDPVGRFPGDQRDPEAQRRKPPQAPSQTPGGVEREEPQTASDAVVETAFPDGRAAGPVSGYLFFAFKGKPKSIKKLELMYQHGEERTPIQLF